MLREDERAQAIQVGAVLVFGFLVIALALNQAYVVPQENKEIEFNDYQAATGDLTNLHSALLAAGGGSPVDSVTVQTGTQYPSRVFAVNPPAPSGRLETTSAGTLSITDAVAVSGEAGNTRSYWNGDRKNFTSKSVAFRPDYAELGGTGPVYVSGFAAYKGFSDAVVSETAQSLIRGDRITLVTVVGDVSASGYTSSLTVEPVSAATRTVTVEGQGGADFNVTLPLPADVNRSAWLDSDLADDVRGNEHVVSVLEAQGGDVNVTFDGGQTYDLRLSKVEVRRTSDSGVVDAPGEKYVVPIQGENASFPSNQTHPVEVEVRDRFNNPVTGVDVGLSFAEGGGAFDPTGPLTTDADGRAWTAFSPSGAQVHRVNASFGGSDPLNSTTVPLQAFTPGAGGGGGGGGGGNVDQVNPAKGGTVILDSQSTVSANGDSGVEITLKNSTGEDSLVEITHARVSFFLNGNSGAGPGQGGVAPTEADLYATSQGVTPGDATQLPVGDDFEPLGTHIPLNPDATTSSDLTTLQLDWDEKVNSEDFYVISLRFDNGDTYTYFVSHPS